MKSATLKRITDDTHTYGVLLVEGLPCCVTLELPWKNNKEDISCIPKGKYMCCLRQSGKHGKTYEVKNVKGRTHILFHIGNYLSKTEGCILLGSEFGDEMICDSSKAFYKFMYTMGNVKSFCLTIE